MVMSFENYNKRQWEKIPENNGRLDMNEVASKEIVNREAREILRSIGCGHEEITRTIAECNGDTSKIQKAIDRIMDNKVLNEENNWETVQSRRTKKATEKNNKKNQVPQKTYGRHNRVFPKPYGRGVTEYSMRDREGGKPYSMNNRTIGNATYGNHKENQPTTGGQQLNKSLNNLHTSNSGGGTSGSGGGIKKGSETRTGLVGEKETKHVEEHSKNEQTERQHSDSKGKVNKGSKKKEKETSEEDKKDNTEKKKESLDKKNIHPSKEGAQKPKDGTNKMTKIDSNNSKPTEGKEDTMWNKKPSANHSNSNNYNNNTNNKKGYRSNDDHSKKDLKGKGTHVSSGTNIGSFTRSNAYPNGDKYYKGYNKFGSRGLNEASMTRKGKPRFNGISNRIGLHNSGNVYFTNYSKGVAKKIYGNKKLNKRKRFVNKNDSDNEYDIYTGMKLNYDMPCKEKETEQEKEKEKEKKVEEKKIEPKVITPKNKTQATSYASVVNNSAKIVAEVESKKCELSEIKEKEKKKNKCQLIPVNNNKSEEELGGDKKSKESSGEGTKIEENANDQTKTEQKKGTNKTAKTKKKKEGVVEAEAKEQVNVKNKDVGHKNETTEIEKGTISYSSMVKKGSELSSSRCKMVDKVSPTEEINNVEEKEGVESKENVGLDKEVEEKKLCEEKELEEKKTGEMKEITNTECLTKEQEEEEEEEESKKKEKKKKKKIDEEKKDAASMEKEKKSKTKKKKSHSEDSKKGSTKGTKEMNLENNDSREEDLIKKGQAIRSNVVDDKIKNKTESTVPMFMPNAFAPLSLEGQLFFGNICISNNTVDEIGKMKQSPVVHDVIEPNRKNKISRENIKDHDRMIRMNLLNENTNMGIADAEQSNNKYKHNQRIEEEVLMNSEDVTRDGNRRIKGMYNNNKVGGGHKEHMNRMNSVNNSMEYKNRRGNNKRGDDYEERTSYHDNKQKFLFSNKNLQMNTKINTSSIHSHMESYLGHHNMQNHRHNNRNNKHNAVTNNDLHGSSNTSNKHFLHSSPMYANQVPTSPHATTSAVVMNAKHKYEHHVKNKNYEEEPEQEVQEEHEQEHEQEHDSGSVEMNVMSPKVLGSHQPDVVASPIEHENTMNANTNNIGTNINTINNINTMNNMRNMTNMNNMNNMNAAMANKNTNTDVSNMNLINMNMNNMNNNNMYSSYNAPPGLANQFNYSFANLSYPYNNIHYNGYNAAAQAMVPQYGLINNHYNKNNNIPPNNNFNYNLNYEGFEENSLYAHNNNMHMNNYVNFVNVGMKKNQMNIEEDNMSNSGDVSISGSLNPMGGINNGDHSTTNVNKNIHVMNTCVDNTSANGMNVSLNAMNNHVNPNLNLSYIDMKNKQHMSNKNNGTDAQIQGGPMNQQVSIHNISQSQHMHSQRKGTHSPINSNNANATNVNQSRNSTQQNKTGTASGGINQFTKNQVHPNHSHRNTSTSMESEEGKTEEGNGNPNSSNVNNTTSTTGPNVNKNENNEDKMEDLENTNKGTNTNVIGGTNTTTAPGMSEAQNQYVNKQLYHNENYYNVNSTNFNVPPGFSVSQEKEPNNNYLNNAITRTNANNAVSAYRNNWNDMNEKNMNHYNVNYNYNRGNKNGYNYSNNMNYNNANTYNGNRENANNFYNYNNYNYALQTPPGLQNFYQNTQYQQQSNYNNRNYNYSAYNNNLSMWNREKQ